MKIACVVLIVVAIYALYVGLDISYKTSVAKKIANDTKAFENISNDKSKALLILGDSTAFGVGADTPEESLGALLAEEIGATYVENISESGAKITDIAEQIERAQLDTYDTILLQVGANDVIRFTDTKMAEDTLRPILLGLNTRADNVIHGMGGNVGAAPFFPLFMQPIYHYRSLNFHKQWEELASELGHVYVNFYASPDEDPFKKNPGVYLAKDGLHPSSAGYQLWFERLKELL